MYYIPKQSHVGVFTVRTAISLQLQLKEIHISCNEVGKTLEHTWGERLFPICTAVRLSLRYTSNLQL
jgi:hypothetical protein